MEASSANSVAQEAQFLLGVALVTKLEWGFRV